MAKEDLSKAELYRKERKERLTKEAKKNAKRNATVAKVKRGILKCVAVVVAAVIVFGAVIGVVNTTGSTVFRSKVASVGNYDISNVEFQYYYMQVYNYYYQYASYGYISGFDTAISPDEQKYTADDPSEDISEETTVADEKSEETTKETTTTNYDTWHDFLSATTLQQLQNTNVLAAEAGKEGIKLSDAEIKEVEDEIEESRSSATENHYTLNAYLKLQYGSGINEKLLKKFMLRDKLAQKYTTEKNNELKDSFTAEEVNKEYNDNKLSYNFVDYRSVTITVDDTTDAKAAKTQANDILAKATSEAAFETAADKILVDQAVAKAESDASSAAEQGAESEKVDPDAIKKQYADNKDDSLSKKVANDAAGQTNADLASWLFNAKTKVGDKKLIEVKEGDEVTSYIVAYMVKTAYRDESNGVNVRHILIKFESEQPTDEQKAATKSKAEEILNEWKNGDATEESFAALATEKTEDTGSASTGGLYENVAPGDMVANFNDWIFDSSRKTGDTGLVETEYGYHIMYFVGKAERQVWDDSVRTHLAEHEYEDMISEKTDSAEYKIEEHSLSMNSAKSKVSKAVKKYIYNASQNSQNSQQASY